MWLLALQVVLLAVVLSVWALKGALDPVSAVCIALTAGSLGFCVGLTAAKRIYEMPATTLSYYERLRLAVDNRTDR